ncbi:glycosyltransferase [uncultured Pseudokineococcus sp.]|uniref:glycosyltransferase n=1 Tax=uncultured Pseudokineococcus sp. TaxID=1642928 RepID=UPI00260FC4C1|nr:glycosyltransferase [uncultured Pseudokineococcus sp.]
MDDQPEPEPPAGAAAGGVAGDATGALDVVAPGAVQVTALLLCTDPSPEAPDRLRRVLERLRAQSVAPASVVAVAAGCGSASLQVLRDHGLEPYLRRRSTPYELVRALPGAPASGRRRPRGADGRRRPTGTAVGATTTGPEAAPADAPVPWLWFLTDDVVPAPDALQRLLEAVELRPGVAVAGPKVRDLDRPGRLLQVGFTTSRRGTALTRVGADELDQGQADDREDVLAVGVPGMLVRRDVLDEVGGFDPALPVDGADLDLCRRVRMAGHSVVVVPAAVVERPGRRADRVGGAPGAAAYTRLVSASPLGLPFALVGVLVAGVLRALWRVLVKDPAHAPAELGRVAGVVLRPDRVYAARRRASRAQVRGRSSLVPLMASRTEVLRHHRDRWSLRRAAEDADAEDAAEAARLRGPQGPGGLPPRRDPLPALLLAAALLVVSLLALHRLLGSGSVQAPALPAAPSGWREVWDAATSSWAALATGSATPPDPLVGLLGAASLVVAGSPGVLVVLLLVLALPVSAVSAWWGAGVVVRGRLARLAAALVWTAGAPLLAGVATGRLGPVLAHAALPWLARSLTSGWRVRSARRAWAVTGALALALIVVGAGAPVLLVPSLLAVLVVGVSRRRRLPLLAALVPVTAVVGPWAVGLVRRALDGSADQALGALLGGPLPPVAAVPAPTWQLALGQPLEASAWAVRGLGLPEGWPGWLLLALPLLVPAAVALVALAAAVLRPRATGGWALVLAGVVLAAAAALVGTGVVRAGGRAVVAAAWAGPGASLALLGLLVAALPLLAGPIGATGLRTVAPDRGVGRGARLAAAAVVAVLGAATTGAWALAQGSTGADAATAAGLVARGGGPVLPEVSSSSAETPQGLRTLVLRPAAAGDDEAGGASPEAAVAEEAGDVEDAAGSAPRPVSAVLARGGVDLSDLSSLVAAAPAAPSAKDADVAALPVAEAAAALVGGDADARERLASLGAGFVVLLPPSGASTAAGTDTASAVDAVAGLQRAADVEGSVLWRLAPPADGGGSDAASDDEGAGTASDLGVLRVLDGDGRVEEVVDVAALSGSAPVPAGDAGRVVVLAEQADDGWTAAVDGVGLVPVESPDPVAPWAQTFALPAEGGALAVRHEGPWWSPSGPWPWVAGAGLLLAALLAVPLPGRRRA